MLLGCECKTTKAHNKCLANITKCPTCRKVVSKPNLCVKTRLDFYFSWPLDIIKSNPKIIGYSKMCGAGLIVLLIGLFICVDKKIIIIGDTDTKFHIGLGILLLVQLFAGFVLALDDYFAKYWLYDEKIGIIRG